MAFTEGTGHLPNLNGRLNPILDNLDRMYLYATNVAINEGKQQPVHFKLNRPLRLTDVNGFEWIVRFIEMIGNVGAIGLRTAWPAKEGPMNRDEILSVLRAHKGTLARRFGVAELAVFGSFARDRSGHRDTHLGDEFLRRVRATRTESATLRMNVALVELPDFACRPGIEAGDHHRAGIVIGPTMDYLEHAYLEARRGDYSQFPVIEMLIPSTVDDSLAPPGRHVAQFLGHFNRRDLYKYAFTGLRLKYRAHPLGITFALGQLDELEGWLSHKQTNALRIARIMRRLPGLEPIGLSTESRRSAYYGIVFRVSGASADLRDRLVDAIKAGFQGCWPRKVCHPAA